MIVHLVDGTYELFRHFFGLRRFTKDKDRPLGAVVGRDAAGVRKKFGVEPRLISDYLALVGDAADGYPGIGAVGAARLLNRHGTIEEFPAAVLGDRRAQALLFKRLATLRTDAPLFAEVDELRWQGPTPAFAAWTERAQAPRLLERCLKAARGS